MRNVVGVHGKDMAYTGQRCVGDSLWWILGRKHLAGGGPGPVAGGPGIVAGIQGVLLEHGGACHLVGFLCTQGGSPCMLGSAVVHLA